MAHILADAMEQYDADWKIICQDRPISWDVTRNPTDLLESYGSEKPPSIKYNFTTTISVWSKEIAIFNFYVVSNDDISILGKGTDKTELLGNGTFFGKIRRTLLHSKIATHS